jgi:hypothetical protein
MNPIVAINYKAATHAMSASRAAAIGGVVAPLGRFAARTRRVGLLMVAIVSGTTLFEARAQTLATFELTPRIEGIEVPITVSINVERAGTGDLTILRLQADLTAMSSKLDQVIDAIWRKEDLEAQRVSHRGTTMVVDGSALRLKVHFRAKPRNLPSSNGSLVLLLQPVIVDDGVGLTGSVAEFNVSNDITRGAIKALRLDDRLKRELDRGLAEALAQPHARLAIPAAARAFGVRVTGASFSPPPPVSTLSIVATLPNSAVAGLSRCLLQVAACPQ